MDIGNKLKTARTNANLTQEQVAESVGVSRQTVSNWENSKSYPDIVSVIQLSTLYDISLDELLKNDHNMIAHLDESTNEIKNRQRFSKLIQILCYLCIWSVSILSFCFGNTDSDVMGYSLMVFYLVLPITTIVISVFIGKDKGWDNYKWLMLLFFGVMYMLASYATFSLANTVSFGKIHFPEITETLPGIICSAIGLAIGSIMRFVHNRKNYNL